MDAIETVKALASAAEIKSLALEWHNDALRAALDEANAEIVRLGGHPVDVPESPVDGGA